MLEKLGGGYTCKKWGEKRKKENNFYFNICEKQAGWKENLATFMTELKNLQATSLSNLGSSLKQAFDLLNLYRLQSGIDNYGMVSQMFN